MEQYDIVTADQNLPRLPRPDRDRRPDAAGPPAPDPRGPARAVLPRLRRRVPGHRPRPGRHAPGDRRRRPQPRRRGRPAPVDLRLPGCGGARDPGVPRSGSRGSTASPAETVVLGTTRRFGSRILRAAQAVGARLPLPGSVPAEVLRDLPAPGLGRTRAPGAGRPAHLRHRPGRGRAPRRPAAPCPPRGRRGLVGHGGAGPLRADHDPAAAPGARRGRGPGRGGLATTPRWSASRPWCRCSTRSAVVVAYDVDDPHDASYVDAQRAQGLLASPLGGLDAADVRALARRLRGREKRPPRGRGAHAARVGRPAPRRAVRPRGAGRRRRPGARGAPRRGAGAAAAPRPATAWRAVPRSRRCSGTLWDGTGWPDRLRSAVGRGGLAARLRAPRPRRDRRALRRGRPRRGAARPHRRRRRSSPPCVAQQIPADTLAERGRPRRRVRLLTAHRAKGLEWPLVVVAHVQEDAWPDLRRRATLLRADRIGSAGLVPPQLGARAAGRGAPAVLRRLHPRPRAAGGDRGRLHRRRRRAALPVPRRARPDADEHRITHVQGRPAPAAVARRAWSPSCAAPSPTPTSRRRCASAAAIRLARLAERAPVRAGRGCPRPTPPPGGAPASWTVGDRAGARPGRAGPAVGQRR